MFVHGTAHLDSPGYPQQRVQPAQGKNGNKQNGHEPERIKKVGIFLGIMVRGVTEVTGKFTRCPRMTLFTRVDDVVPAQVRCRVGNRKNIMRSMAVIALGCFDIPEPGNFAVIRVKIAFGDFFMTLTALVHDVKLEIRLVRTLNRVGRMTGLAGWGFMAAFFSRLFGGDVNTVLKLLIDPQMASGTGFGNVLVVNRRILVLGRQSHVSRVAIGALGRYNEAAFEQTLSVDALGVVFDNVPLSTVKTPGGLLPLSMTFSA